MEYYTQDQVHALCKIALFMTDTSKASRAGIFKLSGYAGTGKTTLISNIAKLGREVKLSPHVMAITNRAVHVVREKLNESGSTLCTSTIHRALYGPPDQNMKFKLGDPSILPPQSLVVVDEASMIPKQIMQDLKTSTFTQGGLIILVGDPFQLPPVGEANNPLLGADAKLSNVVRHDSGLLRYATAIRHRQRLTIPKDSFSNVILDDTPAPWRLYHSTTPDPETVIITGTNRMRVTINRNVRRRLFGDDAPDLYATDILISISNSDNVANGEVFQVQSIDAELDESTITCPSRGAGDQTWRYHKYMVTTTDGYSAELYLFPDVELPSVYHQQIPELSKSDNRTAIVATYGYAISCHKSQGGQWKHAIVYQDWFYDTPQWLYTAVTRASEDLLLCTRPYRQHKDNIIDFSDRFDFDLALESVKFVSQASVIAWCDSNDAQNLKCVF